MSSGKALLGVLAGLTTGILIGILFAPDKGSKTRQRILDKGEDYTDQLKEKFDEFCESITEKFEGIKKNGEEVADKGKVK